MYPEYAEINGKQYKIDTDYRTALKCFDVINDDSIHDYERALAIIYLLFEVVPQNDKELDIFLEKTKYYLQCGKKLEKTKEPDIDFKQDAGYIMSSFMSDYHVDLNVVNLHFWQYIDLIEGLTNECVLNRVRDIRNFDISKEKDAKKRKEIIEMKKRVALKKNDKTKEQQKMAKSIFERVGLRKE